MLLFVVKPTGCCIHELAAMMKAAESIVAPATSQMHVRCAFFERRFQPKIQMPRNVDSKKKAARPSMARGPPKTLPTRRE